MFVRALRFFNPVVFRRFCTTPQNPQNAQLLDEVKAKVFQVIKSAAKCKVEALHEKATFEDLGFDSLDVVELTVAMEENFGFDILDSEAENIKGVEDTIAIFYKYVSQKNNTEVKKE